MDEIDCATYICVCVRLGTRERAEEKREKEISAPQQQKTLVRGLSQPEELIKGVDRFIHAGKEWRGQEECCLLVTLFLL